MDGSLTARERAQARALVAQLEQALAVGQRLLGEPAPSGDDVRALRRHRDEVARILAALEALLPPADSGVGRPHAA